MTDAEKIKEAERLEREAMWQGLVARDRRNPRKERDYAVGLAHRFRDRAARLREEAGHGG